MKMEVRLSGVNPEKVSELHKITASQFFPRVFKENNQEQLITITSSRMNEGGKYSLKLEVKLQAELEVRDFYTRGRTTFNYYHSLEEFARFFRIVNSNFFPEKGKLIPDDEEVAKVVAREILNKRRYRLEESNKRDAKKLIGKRLLKDVKNKTGEIIENDCYGKLKKGNVFVDTCEKGGTVVDVKIIMTNNFLENVDMGSIEDEEIKSIVSKILERNDSRKNDNVSGGEIEEFLTELTRKLMF